MTSRRKRIAKTVLFLLSGCTIILVTAFLIVSVRMPNDAPLARMYRTEADLRALSTSIRAYVDAHGVYPPQGAAGLQSATACISHKADYFPQGPPLDGWGRPFCYVSHTDYQREGSGAIMQQGMYLAPDTYQLYSCGADGDSGLDDIAARRDNICSWDPAKTWRTVYHELQTTYYAATPDAGGDGS